MSENLKDAKAIFLDSIEKKDTTDRNRFLDQACGSDVELRHRVEQLIFSYEGGGSFMEHKPGAVFMPTAIGERVSEQPGSIIGSYKLLQEIGEGGFGLVYMAEQTKPVRRQVALKIIKPGMDTGEIIARFEAERQALALMDHPNIAQVFDAGTTASGRPYFVMELVKGVPLIEFCDSNSLSTPARLNLFVTVCRALQHAHHKGIIHRDLKPSNVMVTMHDGKSVPKVIDFGVSKAVSQQLTDRTLFTAYGQMIGTPAYMSPEQAEMSGLDVDIRSDIYSLGVLLYELLTGSTPLDARRLRSTAYAEMQRLIREEEPPKPSERISTIGEVITRVAKQRNTDPKHLVQLISGDLDWIVMKALEKERDRRYDTANNFAADIERFLNNEAIEARPPSAAYRLRKFARRNRTVLATAVMIVIALVAGIIGTTWQAFRATQQRNRAVAAEKRAHDEAHRANESAEVAKSEAAVNEAVLDFVKNDLLGQADPHVEPDRNLKLSAVLSRASTRIQGRFDDQPAVEASIRWTLGDTCFSLGEFAASRVHLERALELNRQQYGSKHAETLRVLTRIADLEHDEENYYLAKSLLKPVVETAREALGDEHPITLHATGRLADMRKHLGDLASAEILFRETIAKMRQVLGIEDARTLLCMNDLALVYVKQERLDEAEVLYRDVLDVCHRVLGPEHPRTLESMFNLAFLHEKQGRDAEAEKLHLETFELRNRVLGSDHPRTLRSMEQLANAAAHQGRKDQAESLRREISRRRIRAFEPEQPMTVTTANHLASAYEQLQQYDTAEQLYNGQIEQLKQLVTDAPEVTDYRLQLAATYSDLAALLRKSRDLPAAISCYLQAIELYQQLVLEWPDEYPYRIGLAKRYATVAWLHETSSKPQDAAAFFEKAAACYLAVPEPRRQANDWGHLGQVLYRAGRYTEARTALEKGIKLRKDEGPTSAAGPRWWYLVMTLHKLGETERAREYFDDLSEQTEHSAAKPSWVRIRWDEADQLLRSHSGADGNSLDTVP